MRSLTWQLVLSAWLALPGTAGTAAGPDPDQTPPEEKVATLLTQRCVKCHGPLKPKGKLNLSTLRGVARGGESGVVVVPTHAKDSILWQRVDVDEMPPEHPLSAVDKALLREWIDAGAAGLPRGELGPPIGGDHWAFQPLRKPGTPNVRQDRRVRTEIDRWIQAGLEARGLSLGPDADRTTLIRRVCFDLTGLPPTPREVSEFVLDPAPDAYERMVDCYLSSPRYGERWGQYWLDAAGYADSSGFFSNERDRPLAWRYRDYVIGAFNRDLPFDQFVREQIAGDELIDYRPGGELTLEQQRALIATQFLSNAPDGTDQSAASPEAQREDRYAALEGTQQVIASSLLGLSLKCARCHDHKLEPIRQKEYYQIQSILLPALNPVRWTPPLSRKATVPLAGETAAWKAETEALEQRIAALKREQSDLNREIQDGLPVVFSDTSGQPASVDWCAAAPGDEAPKEPVVLDAEKSGRHCAIRKGTQLRLIACQAAESWVSTKLKFHWTPDDVGQSIQVTFDLVSDQTTVGGKATAPAGYFGYYIAMHDFHRRKAPGGNILIDGRTQGPGKVYLDYPGDKARIHPFTNTAYQPGRNYGVRITNRGEGRYQLLPLVDFLPDGEGITLTASDLPDGGFGFYLGVGRSFVVENISIAQGAFASGPGSSDEKRKAAAGRRRQIGEEIKKLHSQIKPGAGAEIALTTDAGPEPPGVYILRRGNYGENGEAVQPAGLEILSDPTNTLTVEPRPAASRTTGRRLAFARWLTKSGSRAEALLARVQVNRVWLNHFHRGLTPNPENLGLSGGRPIHPELLELLSALLIEQGWRFKPLHRLILTSTVYRQASAPSDAGLSADPENRRHWRFPLHRLDAEAIRDAMLAASGELDLAGGGPFVPIARYGSEQEVTRGALNREIVVKEETPGAHRRSIFIEHRRWQIPTFLALFGTPSISMTSAERPSSAVPLQSLSQLNSEFARRRSRAMAQRLLTEAGKDPGRQIHQAFVLTLGRPPSRDEGEDARRFLSARQAEDGAAPAELPALTDLCQMLFASNLFLYVE